jgi:acetylornithine deacetylase/succinyl-diaminopimelate desuccinylase-like protein
MNVGEEMMWTYENPAGILQRLIQFDTTNPPGNERTCIEFVAGLLEAAGIPVTVLAKDPQRPNLIARLPGRGAAPPLLLYGHVDVVTTAGQDWQHPPFGGQVIDGYIWGRGALDMKGGVAMLLSAFLKAKAEGLEPAGDLILAIVSDEEQGGVYGARYLVEEQAHLFAGVKYAIGEFGGFSLFVGEQKFYTIGVAEKQICSLQAVFRGPAGHGSRPIRGGAMAKLAAFLQKIDENRLPAHITPVVQQLIEQISRALPEPAGSMVAALLVPGQTDAVLAAMGSQAALFDAILHNTVSPTIVRGGDALNVIPGEVTLRLDGRLLPGMQPEDMLLELRDLVGEEPELTVTNYEPGPPPPDMTHFDTLAGILRDLDPAGIPIPLMLTGVTDSRHFAHLGIQTYGFLPMNLPPDFAFTRTMHAADERIPVESVQFGTAGVFRFLQQYGN